jgi:hypothetical protein
VVWSILVGAWWGVVGGVGGGSMCVLWGGKCDGGGGVLAVFGVLVGYFPRLS